MRVWLRVALIIIMLALFRGYGAGLPQGLWTVESGGQQKGTSPRRPVGSIFDSSLCSYFLQPPYTSNPTGSVVRGSLSKEAHRAVLGALAAIPIISRAVDPACCQKMDFLKWRVGAQVGGQKGKVSPKPPSAGRRHPG